jgi:hypothetical protein
MSELWQVLVQGTSRTAPAGKWADLPFALNRELSRRYHAGKYIYRWPALDGPNTEDQPIPLETWTYDLFNFTQTSDTGRHTVRPLRLLTVQAFDLPGTARALCNRDGVIKRRRLNEVVGDPAPAPAAPVVTENNVLSATQSTPHPE